MANLKAFSTRAVLLLAASGGSALALAACSSPDPVPANPNDSGTDNDSAVQADSAAPDSGTADSGPLFTMDDGVQVLGRVDTSAVTDMKTMIGTKMSWPGAQIRVKFKGTEIKVTLRETKKTAFTFTDYSQFLVIVDGAITKTLKLKDTTLLDEVLATGLEDKEHEVELFRKTEASLSTTTFSGFTFNAGATVLPIARPTRKIEFIGDSITVGYGADIVGPYDSTFAGFEGIAAGPATAKCPKYFATDTRTDIQKELDAKTIVDSTNAYIAYPAIVARSLKAEAHVVAWSGKGLVKNLDASDTLRMLDLYPRADATQSGSVWDNSKWSADAVVINLGTNDVARNALGVLQDPGAAFGLKYGDLLTAVRTNHPNAIIFSVVGPMLENRDVTPGFNPKTKILGYINKAIAERRTAGDTKVKNATEVTQSVGNVGCEFHPYRDTQADVGNTLVSDLRLGVPGWR